MLLKKHGGREGAWGFCQTTHDNEKEKEQTKLCTFSRASMLFPTFCTWGTFCFFFKTLHGTSWRKEERSEARQREKGRKERKEGRRAGQCLCLSDLFLSPCLILLFFLCLASACLPASLLHSLHVPVLFILSALSLTLLCAFILHSSYAHFHSSSLLSSSARELFLSNKTCRLWDPHFSGTGHEHSQAFFYSGQTSLGLGCDCCWD